MSDVSTRFREKLAIFVIASILSFLCILLKLAGVAELFDALGHPFHRALFKLLPTPFVDWLNQDNPGNALVVTGMFSEWFLLAVVLSAGIFVVRYFQKRGTQ